MTRPKGSKSSRIHIWTPEEKNYLASIVEGHSYKEIQTLMFEFGVDLTLDQVKGATGRYKLNTGLNGQFKKGHVPFNKGKKGIGGWEPTQFKKGNVPVNHRPVGSERVNVDGYVEIKVAEPNKWKCKHRVVWESVNGPIPKGHIIIFADSNKQNLDIENLILISRSKVAILNKYNLIKNDASLTKTGLIIADIYSKISDRKSKK